MPTPQAYNRLYEEHEALKAALKSHYISLFMDGRNEHGTHLLDMPGGTSAPQAELFFRDALDARDDMAEEIFAAAEALGHDAGHSIVVRVRVPENEEDCWDFLGIDEMLTAVMHGTAAEQSAEMAEAMAHEPVAIKSFLSR